MKSFTDLVMIELQSRQQILSKTHNNKNYEMDWNYDST
jgi:hypothetical protein